MKKESPWKRELAKRRFLRIQHQCIKFANAQRHRKGFSRTTLRSLRREYIDNLYKKVKFNKLAQTIEITGEFGIENQDRLDHFFRTARQILSSRARNITLDFSNAQRLWPSAITLLCSFSHYTSLISVRGNSAPIVQSIHPANEVGDYLTECGFNRYVGRRNQQYLPSRIGRGIVRIRREANNRDVSLREEEITDLVREFSNYTDDQIEEFDSIILPEIFNNVTEHGITHIDKGWWVLAQYHRIHNFLSICIADNGIGIRKTLVFGPQRQRILRYHKDEAIHEGDFIQTAAEKINISGAINASSAKHTTVLGMTVPGMSRYDRGARRGRGLKRIINSCFNLGITLTIISRSGFYQKVPNQAAMTKSFEKDIFSGTMYHLLVPLA